MTNEHSNVFKVGDKVRGVGNYDGRNIDRDGVVKDTPSGRWSTFLVDFGPGFDGHNGCGRAGKEFADGTCWNVPQAQLKHVATAPLEITKDDVGRRFKQADGTIVEVREFEPHDSGGYPVGARVVSLGTSADRTSMSRRWYSLDGQRINRDPSQTLVERLPEEVKEAQKTAPASGGFKVGDRVQIVGRIGTNRAALGVTGTVVDFARSSSNPLVECDQHVGGHDGLGGTKSGKRFKDGHCWYVPRYGLKKLPTEPAKPTFEKGDVVRLVNNRGMSASKGALAVIEKVPNRLNKFLYVRWIKDHNSQMDGGYSPEDFELAQADPKDLKNGDRVLIVWPGSRSDGHEGVFRCLSAGFVAFPGVEIDGWDRGHTCHGNVPSGRGWWIDEYAGGRLVKLPKLEPVVEAAARFDGCIVIEEVGGKLAPAPAPKVHQNRYDAAREAYRLAKKFPGRTFHVFEAFDARRAEAS